MTLQELEGLRGLMFENLLCFFVLEGFEAGLGFWRVFARVFMSMFSVFLVSLLKC